MGVITFLSMRPLSFLLITFIYLECVHVTCGTQRTRVAVSSILPPCESWGMKLWLLGLAASSFTHSAISSALLVLCHPLLSQPLKTLSHMTLQMGRGLVQLSTAQEDSASLGKETRSLGLSHEFCLHRGGKVVGEEPALRPVQPCQHLPVP